ncbi:SWIM zinc finger family protein [Aquabacterium humicola]|uniref:SWIM zinc finger family protein n=1 Tax=Aquabacterium humicola TaxID=3237377 RepID=UPI0025432645|nr:SWIM zinc finger family protein [Rubrivivax pictus]
MFRQGRHGLQVDGTCTCPVVVDCKHAAALLLAALPAARSTTGARSELVDWLEAFKARRDAEAAAGTAPAKDRPAKNAQVVAYVLTWSDYEQRHEVRLFKARRSSDIGDTSFRAFEAWNNVEAALVKAPKFVSEEDLTILRVLWLGHKRDGSAGFALKGANGAAAP